MQLEENLKLEEEKKLEFYRRRVENSPLKDFLTEEEAENEVEKTVA